MTVLEAAGDDPTRKLFLLARRLLELRHARRRDHRRKPAQRYYGKTTTYAREAV